MSVDPHDSFTGLFDPGRSTNGSVKPDWGEFMPIDLTALTDERRLDLQTAAQAVLDAAPQVLPEPRPPLYEADPDPQRLPLDAPQVAGLCGKPQAGKDVVADYLVAHYQDVERMAFSDAIVDEVNDYLANYPYPSDDGESRRHVIVEANKSNPAYRHLLQAWGMARRDEEAQHWTRRVKEKVRGFGEQGTDLSIVTGVRMPSDVDVIGELEGPVWRVVRPGNTYQAEHAVEAGLDHLPDDAFITIYNSVEGNLRAYEANIEAVLRNRPQPFTDADSLEAPSRARSVLAFLDATVDLYS